LKVLVLGAGVIGVATAHYLAEDGHEVTVLDRQPATGLETSFGNAGNVCPSYATPWAAPGMRWKAAKWLLERDAPLAVRWHADASLLHWAASWLANCSRRRFEQNKARMQRLSHYSLACLQRLRGSLGLHYDETTQGILQLLRTERELAAVVDHTRILEAAGIPRELAEWVDAMHLSPYALIAVLTVVYLILGTALDGISMIVLTSAVILPMIQKPGFDLVWFGIFIVLLVEIAEVTPPVGFNLFVLQNMTGRDSNYIARAALPFFAMLVLTIGIITVFPDVVLWLPRQISPEFLK